MTTKKIISILYIINIIVPSILLTDTFLLPLKESFKICKDKIVFDGSGGRYNHSQYAVIDEQGKKYNAPRDFCLVLDIDEKFIITTTALFGKTICVNFKLNLPEEKEKVGVLNTTWLGECVPILLILLSLFLLFYPKVFKQEDVAGKVCKLITMLTGILLLFYFIYQV